ncbi:hypothetical protein AAIG86_29120, partial [Pseudomonas aeruginosa]
SSPDNTSMLKKLIQTIRSPLRRPRAVSRLVGCYMLFYAAGSGLGASAGTAMYAWAGWDAVSLLGAAISLAALAFWWFTRGVGGEARTACANGA